MLTRRPLAARRGFTLAEVLVAFTLIAVLAAVVVPSIRARLQDAYEDAIISEFDNLANGLAAYRQDVGKYPPRLDYLATLPSPSVDRCNVSLSTQAKNAYRGPYVTRFIQNSVGYIMASKDTMYDSLYTTGSPTTGIAMKVYGPDSLTARNVDLKVDGLLNATNGTVQWASNGTAPNIDYYILYIVPTRSGTC